MIRALLAVLSAAALTTASAEEVRNAVTTRMLANRSLALYSAASCTAVACTLTGQTCTSGTTFHVCDTAAGFFTAAGSFDLGAHTWTGPQTFDAGASITDGQSIQFPPSLAEISRDGFTGIKTNGAFRANGLTTDSGLTVTTGNIFLSGAGSTVDGKDLDFAALTNTANSFTAAQTLGSNAVSDLISTLPVANNATGTLNVGIGFSRVWLRSLEVLSGCDLYDFSIYSRDTLNPGEEILSVIGQSFNYFDGAPPALVDADGTNEIHAKFWNRAGYPCTFEVRLEGAGF